MPNTRIDRPDKEYRASSNCICEICGKKYYDHPMDKEVTDWHGEPFLNILCNGDRVKL